MDTSLLLKSIIIPFYVNVQCNELGHDSKEHCFDSTHYKKFGPVSYQFNELGYRTCSTSQFTGNEILAIGDSFTLGLGVNIGQRWTEYLESNINYPVLNFSLNGASNDWIARRTKELLEHFTPRAVILHYSFSHRREHHDITWHDNERTLCDPGPTDAENFDNWRENFNKINQCCGDIPVVHSFIPNWHTTAVDYHKYGNNILEPIIPVDRARDAFHYGANTHKNLADKITNLLVL